MSKQGEILNWKKNRVPNSPSGPIFVKIRAESGLIFSKNPGKTQIFVSLSSFCD